MNIILSRFLVSAALLALCSCGSSHTEADHDHDHHSDDEQASHPVDLHDHNAEHDGHESHSPNEIILEPEQADRFGVKTDSVFPGDFAQVVRVSGEIVTSPGASSVVAAPSSGIVKIKTGIQPGKLVSAGAPVASVSAASLTGGDRNLADKAALDAALKEVERLRPLYQEGIVSAKDFNAALSAYEQAKSQYSPAAASGVAKASTAGVITDVLVSDGQFVDAGQPLALVSSSRRLTLRADIPDRYYNFIPLVSSARIALPYSKETVDLAQLNCTRVSPEAPTSRVSAGYIPLYFSFDNDGRSVAGSVVDVYLLGAPRKEVIAVPLSAITEQQGGKFVFVKIDDEGYMKVPVTVGASDGLRCEITKGLSGGELVVVDGVSAVRLAETSSVVPEGHSHSH